MAITYKILKRKNLQAPTDPKKFYPIAASRRTVPFRELVELITHSSSATKGDIQLAIDGLIFQMIITLSRGEVIELGEFGYFRMTVHAKGSETKDELNAANFKPASIRFIPGRALKNMIKGAEYECIGEILDKDDVITP